MRPLAGPASASIFLVWVVHELPWAGLLINKGTGQIGLRPTSRDLGRGNLEKRTGSFARGDIGIVFASFAMHSDGKIPDVQVGKIEKRLRHRSKSDERALRALPGKVARCTTTDLRWGFHQPDRASRSISRVPEKEPLWASAIRLRMASGGREEKS